jgi:membrane-bound lytic murein transglycosylase B
MIVPAAATAPCGGDFGTWLEGLKEEATAQGVSQSTIQS